MPPPPRKRRSLKVENLEQRQLLTITMPTLLDDGDIGYVQSGTDWQAHSGAGNEGDYLTSAPGSGRDKATWSFDSLTPGAAYHVMMSWTADSHHATDAPVAIRDGRRLLGRLEIDQTALPDVPVGRGRYWQELGVFQVDSGTLNITLSDKADGHVVADAIGIMEVDPNEHELGISYVAPDDRPAVGAEPIPRGVDDPVTLESLWDDLVMGPEVVPGIQAVAMAASEPSCSTSPRVVGRHTFCNNSSFDTNSDADAIPPTPESHQIDDHGMRQLGKRALLPGETATFANYTSYNKGINGIMVDILNAPSDGANITASDFTFKVGNDGTPSSWSTAPAPSSVTVSAGSGDHSSDRVTIIWADNAIENEWLQVTVDANTNTGLSADDVFYYGNAMGESGNSDTDAYVTSDQSAQTDDAYDLWGALHTSGAAIDDPYDHDRDGDVDSMDLLIVRNNLADDTTGDPLLLINAPATANTPSRFYTEDDALKVEYDIPSGVSPNNLRIEIFRAIADENGNLVLQDEDLGTAGVNGLFFKDETAQNGSVPTTVQENHVVTFSTPTFTDPEEDYYLVAQIDSDVASLDEEVVFAGGVFLDATNDIIHIFGTGCSDMVNVWYIDEGSDYLKVDLDSVNPAVDMARYYLKSGVDEIHFRAHGERDGLRATSHTSFTEPIWGFGGAGVDTIWTEDGNDRIHGGADLDWLLGGKGNDLIYGNEGPDRLEGEEGDDELAGNEGNDTLYGGDGMDELLGNEDNDTIYGGAGDDEIEGHAGNDILYGDADNDLIEGWGGADQLYGDGRASTPHTGSGNDTLIGGHRNTPTADGVDTIYGGGGDDLIQGFEGNDTLYGGPGNDRIDGWKGADNIYGDNGTSANTSTDGNDELWGGDGNDTMYGTAGHDNLFGELGNDTLYGGSGDDFLMAHLFDVNNANDSTPDYNQNDDYQHDTSTTDWTDDLPWPAVNLVVHPHNVVIDNGDAGFIPTNAEKVAGESHPPAPWELENDANAYDGSQLEVYGRASEASGWGDGAAHYAEWFTNAWTDEYEAYMTWANLSYHGGTPEFAVADSGMQRISTIDQFTAPDDDDGSLRDERFQQLVGKDENGDPVYSIFGLDDGYYSVQLTNYNVPDTTLVAADAVLFSPVVDATVLSDMEKPGSLANRQEGGFFQGLMLQSGDPQRVRIDVHLYDDNTLTNETVRLNWDNSVVNVYGSETSSTAYSPGKSWEPDDFNNDDVSVWVEPVSTLSERSDTQLTLTVHDSVGTPVTGRPIRDLVQITVNV